MKRLVLVVFAAWAGRAEAHWLEDWAAKVQAEMREVVERSRAQPPPVVENDVFRLKAAPRGYWKAVETGNDASITVKKPAGVMTFRAVAAEGTAEEALARVEGERVAWAPEGAGGPSAIFVGAEGKRAGVVILSAKGFHVVARLECAEKDWAKLEKVFVRVLKGFEAK